MARTRAADDTDEAFLRSSRRMKGLMSEWLDGIRRFDDLSGGDVRKALEAIEVLDKTTAQTSGPNDHMNKFLEQFAQEDLGGEFVPEPEVEQPDPEEPLTPDVEAPLTPDVDGWVAEPEAPKAPDNFSGVLPPETPRPRLATDAQGIPGAPETLSEAQTATPPALPLPEPEKGPQKPVKRPKRKRRKRRTAPKPRQAPSGRLALTLKRGERT